MLTEYEYKKNHNPAISLGNLQLNLLNKFKKAYCRLNTLSSVNYRSSMNSVFLFTLF